MGDWEYLHSGELLFWDKQALRFQDFLIQERDGKEFRFYLLHKLVQTSKHKPQSLCEGSDAYSN